MKLLTGQYKEQLFIGVLLKEHYVLDLKQTAQKMKRAFPYQTLQEGIEDGDLFLNVVRELSEAKEEDRVVYDRKDVTFLPPLLRPKKNIFCVGKNYASHVIELGSKEDIPEHVMIFTKAPTTVIGHQHSVPHHKEVTEMLDYEGELAVVIGKTIKGINKDEVWDAIFGYTILNDITARDLQERHKQFFLGKSLDETCPIGPYIVTKDELPNPHCLTIETKINGDVRQHANTEQFIFNIPTIVLTLSKGMTLEPGDIIATGTPAGVGKGMKPPQFLKPGDVMEVTIEGIGTLVNVIKSESENV